MCRGLGAKAFAYHFVVADADMNNETNNNLEVIARLINDMHQKYGAMPLAISLIQDNTSRNV